MYNKSKIFTEAWERARNLKESFSDSLRAVWAFYKKNAYTKSVGNEILNQWEQLCTTNDISKWSAAKKNVDKIIATLRATYNTLAGIGTQDAIITANIIVSIIKNKHQVPTYRQIWAVLCGAWENNIIIHL